MTDMSVGLGRIINDPQASILVRKALGALSTPALLVTNEGVTIDTSGRIAIKLNPNGKLAQDADGLRLVEDANGTNKGRAIDNDWIGVDVRMEIPELTVIDTAWNYFSGDATLGFVSTIANQYGFYAGPMTKGGTRTAAFAGDVAAGLGRWNVYMAGTASNHFKGSVAIGTEAVAAKLHIVDTAEQLRVAYDANNYASVTVDNTGNVTLSPVAPTTPLVAPDINFNTVNPGGVRFNGGYPVYKIMAGGVVAITLPSVAALAWIEFPVVGALPGDLCFVSPFGLPNENVISWSGVVTAPDTVRIRLLLQASGPADTRDWRAMVIRFTDYP